MASEDDFLQFLTAKGERVAQFDTERFPTLFAKIRHHFAPKTVIHLVGTNGKGSTGRFIAHYLHKQHHSVGHFSSPHLLSVNERFWQNGNDATSDELQHIHKALLTMLSPEELQNISYFEYTTLMAFKLFEPCDYWVIEAGVGGEFDSTNVLAKTRSIVTKIGFDHEAMLGTTIESIAKTKLRSIQNPAIIAPQEFEEVYASANELGIAYQKVVERDEVKRYIKAHSFAPYFSQNLSTALVALESLGFNPVLSCFDDFVMRGRFERIATNIWIDVGHNPSSAQAIKKSLGAKKVKLIYNTYEDKNYPLILEILKENIEQLLVINIDNVRILDTSILREYCLSAGIPWGVFSTIQSNAEYLVYGSFSVVEGFIKIYEK